MRINKQFKLLFLSIALISISEVGLSQNCLYKNPLCFYNTDVLSYLKILHQNQQYEKMAPFFYGPYVSKMNKLEFINRLSEQDFGYEMKRSGIKEESKGNWSLTYTRTILGTKSKFKIKCSLVNDTCRVYLDDNTWAIIFK